MKKIPIISDFISKKGMILVFLFFTIIIIASGILYIIGLSPTDSNIEKIIDKYSTGDYRIPYYVGERYLIWYSMRTFFVALNYLLSLLGIIATLVTIFYASNKGNNNIIVFLSLLSMCFNVASYFINPNSKANMSQHIWRELDICIMQTVTNDELNSNEKDTILVNKIAELERYVETFEK